MQVAEGVLGLVVLVEARLGVDRHEGREQRLVEPVEQAQVGALGVELDPVGPVDAGRRQRLAPSVVAGTSASSTTS